MTRPNLYLKYSTFAGVEGVQTRVDAESYYADLITGELVDYSATCSCREVLSNLYGFAANAAKLAGKVAYFPPFGSVVEFGLEIKSPFSEVQKRNLLEFMNLYVVRNRDFNVRMTDTGVVADWPIASPTVSLMLLLMRDYIHLFEGEKPPELDKVIEALSNNPAMPWDEDIFFTCFYIYLLGNMYVSLLNLAGESYFGPADYARKVITYELGSLKKFFDKYGDVFRNSNLKFFESPTIKTLERIVG